MAQDGAELTPVRDPFAEDEPELIEENGRYVQLARPSTRIQAIGEARKFLASHGTRVDPKYRPTQEAQ